MIRPDFDTFTRLAREGDLVVVSRVVPFDTETAVTAYAKLSRPPFSFLLESVTGGETWARWTFLGTRPREAWRLDAGGGIRTWRPDAGWSDAVASDDPLGHLETLVAARRPVTPPGTPRFFGGAVGYLGYDVVRTLERLPAGPADDTGIPEAILMMTDVVVAIDMLYGRAHVMAAVDVAGAAGAALRRRYDDGIARIDDVLATLAATPAPPPLRLSATAPPVAVESGFTRGAFEGAVRRIQEYIAAGDAFQVVLSQRLEVPLRARPFDLYRALRSVNPSPYMYYLELDGVVLAGASPEVLVRVEDGEVTVRPIAGTRPRGSSEAEDRALAAELMADPKERSEHLMLVDLGRNDVGRVAEYGSVRVPDFMTVERYSHVHHMVSRVTGRLRDGLTAMDAFRATFPAGTVSGAPKVRAMEIIDELEPTRRGPYAGAVGYFAYGGRAMDTAIAIRTLVAAGGRAWIQAGAGVVADSDPGREYEETLSKARAVLAALGAVEPPGP
ncbi:MAG TPA: anthranilate synthase component I [Longimicrobiales bacterium]|nr:anthranilate synthase component I [Longimicrobiales bacterium]